MFDSTIINVAPNSLGRLYAAPRRFDLATTMVVTIAYALLFGALRSMRSEPIVFVVVAGFITSVGIAQALLFGGKKPRMSSVLVGLVCSVGFDMTFGSFRLVRGLGGLLTSSAICGAVLGYVAGVAVGSVFLMSDVMGKTIQRWKHR